MYPKRCIKLKLYMQIINAKYTLLMKIQQSQKFINYYMKFKHINAKVKS